MMQKRSETGASAVEYGLLVALIAAVLVSGVIGLGLEVSALFVKARDMWP